VQENEVVVCFLEHHTYQVYCKCCVG